MVIDKKDILLHLIVELFVSCVNDLLSLTLGFHPAHVIMICVGRYSVLFATRLHIPPRAL